MSFDRLLEHSCPHYIREELLPLSEDRTTVTPIRPISAFNSVRVKLNGRLVVPQQGLYCPPKATSSREGNFSFTPGQTLEVYVPNKPTQTFTALQSKGLTPDRVSDLLNLNFSGVGFSVQKSRLEAKGTLEGPQSTLRFGGTLAATLGFKTEREYRGATVVPAWSLVSDPRTLSDRPLKLIIFDDPIKTSSNQVEVDYTTVREECRRCGGLGKEHDWRYFKGRVVEARDEVLLLQEFTKALFTIRGSNPFNSWYGSELDERIGRKQVSAGMLRNQITQDVNETFRRYQGIKKEYEVKLGAQLSDAEFPYQLGGVQVTSDPASPTIVYLQITLRSRALSRTIPLTRALRLSEPLLG